MDKKYFNKNYGKTLREKKRRDADIEKAYIAKNRARVKMEDWKEEMKANPREIFLVRDICFVNLKIGMVLGGDCALVYGLLQRYYEHFAQINKLTEDGAFEASYQMLGKPLKRDGQWARRKVKILVKANIIKTEGQPYTANKFWLLKLPKQYFPPDFGIGIPPYQNDNQLSLSSGSVLRKEKNLLYQVVIDVIKYQWKYGMNPLDVKRVIDLVVKERKRNKGLNDILKGINRLVERYGFEIMEEGSCVDL